MMVTGEKGIVKGSGIWEGWPSPGSSPANTMATNKKETFRKKQKTCLVGLGKGTSAGALVKGFENGKGKGLA